MLFRSDDQYFEVRLVDGLYRCDCPQFKMDRLMCRHIEQVADQGLWIEEETAPLLPTMKQLIEEQMDYVYPLLKQSRLERQRDTTIFVCPTGRLKTLKGRCMCGGKDMVWEGQTYTCDACGEEMCCLVESPVPVIRQIVVNCLDPNLPMNARMNQYITLASLADSVGEMPCPKQLPRL